MRETVLGKPVARETLIVRRSQMKSRRSVTLTLLGAFLLLLTAASQAQNGGYSNLTFQPKSAGAALRCSLFGTVVPVATGIATIAMADKVQLITRGMLLVGSGIVVGPSVGYFYGGCGGRGGTGIAIRLGLGALTSGVMAVGASPSNEGFLLGALLVGSGLATIHAIYDVAKVKSTVRKHNERLQARSLGVVPTYLPDSDAPGLALQLTF
jgi:hypothetical protein